jgi:hypothetical protein
MISCRELFAEFRDIPPGFVGQNYLMAWGIDELARTNKNYLVEEAAP